MDMDTRFFPDATHVNVTQLASAAAKVAAWVSATTAPRFTDAENAAGAVKRQALKDAAFTRSLRLNPDVLNVTTAGFNRGAKNPYVEWAYVFRFYDNSSGGATYAHPPEDTDAGKWITSDHPAAVNKLHTAVRAYWLVQRAQARSAGDNEPPTPFL